MNEETWEYFWHPVCTLTELRSASDRGPIKQIKLLGRKLVIAELDCGVVAMDDRCAHRSASLALGSVESNCIRCPYHGWLYDNNGKCVEIPAMPDLMIPKKAKVNRYEVEVRYDLVWVKLKPGLELEIPVLRSWDDPKMKCVQGNAYEWPTSGPRRMENFFDLAHFAFIHDGSLGTREDPLVPIPEIDQLLGQLRWKYYPENRYGATSDASKDSLRIPMDYADYVAQLPFHISLVNKLKDGSQVEIWMCASPIKSDQVRCFWFSCRSEDHDGDDSKYIDIQESVVLKEDLPVVASQDPKELPHPSLEISVPTDKIHVNYRRRLFELSNAYTNGGVKTLAEKLTEVEIETDENYEELLQEAP